MTQPTLFDQIHDRSTQIYLAVETNRERAKSNCEKLLRFWRTQNRHISKYDAAQMGIDCLAQRVKNLKDAGYPVESETRRDLGEVFARYYLKCTCEDGSCYLHNK
jgi:hypothetical protein